MSGIPELFEARAPAGETLTDGDNASWLQCWHDRQTGFHQAAINPLLTRFWPELGLDVASRIFVPLCGKSLDMLWLAQQGHEVIGVELSPIAVRAFFKENRLRPTRRPAGLLTLWQAGRISILCGDYFALTSSELGQIDAVYDRAALTAFPEDVRLLYVAHLKLILPTSGKVFILTTEMPDSGALPAQTLEADPELMTLYGAAFNIELLHVEHAFEPHPEGSHLPPEALAHKVYRLSLKSGESCLATGN
ncbi:MAG: thiopurine S-methyltransferase [Gammaproteobacteria bacterium 28-57-27]|nr:MAG: thiopurine S-methyltransferase [Gammaproteobacteria bacterium 28-57-27]